MRLFALQKVRFKGVGSKPTKLLRLQLAPQVTSMNTIDNTSSSKRTQMRLFALHPTQIGRAIVAPPTASYCCKCSHATIMGGSTP